MAHAPNTGIEELYRSVIQEVIEQSKEACLDENIDTEILYHLQKVWEDKINASGVANLNHKTHSGVPKVRPSQPKLQSGRSMSNLAMIIPQVDGGPHMSDSSSEEEDDENDPSPQMVEQIADDVDGSDDPLNSADDQSDDEDLETLFESSNVIVCQFEKVNRARNKWKFSLKDGIMHLNGKDYCFQKCTGEAEW